MKNKALFGPSGCSSSFTNEGHKHTFEVFEWLKKIGLDAFEYPGGNGIRGSLETYKKIGEEAKKWGVVTSLHTPYFISLSGVDTEKRLHSLEYIKQSLQAADAMNADIIVIHAGSAAKISREEAVNLAKDTMYKALETFSDTKIKFGIETMGKINQLGTLDEVLDICSIDGRLCPVVDFGHINARNIGNYFNNEDDYKVVFDKIANTLGSEYAQNLHCHFSKIEYVSSGEKRHLTFADTEFGPDFEPLGNLLYKEGLTPRIICESAGTQSEDALFMKNYYNGLF